MSRSTTHNRTLEFFLFLTDSISTSSSINLRILLSHPRWRDMRCLFPPPPDDLKETCLAEKFPDVLSSCSETIIILRSNNTEGNRIITRRLQFHLKKTV